MISAMKTSFPCIRIPSRLFNEMLNKKSNFNPPHSEHHILFNSLSMGITTLCRVLLGIAIISCLYPQEAIGQSQLPQDNPYQVELYDWLETITIQDVAISTGTLQFNGGSTNVEELADLFLMTQDLGTLDDSPRFAYQGEAKWFVLDDGQGAGIEGSGTVKMLRWANEPAFVYQLDLPNGGGQGNPYYQDPAMCTRALVSTAVDLIMLDWEHDQGNSVRSDFLGGTLNALAYAYYTCNAIIDQSAQAAFEAGFDHMMDKLLQWGPRQVNTNMDTRAIAAVSYLYRSSSDAAFKDKAIRVAKRFMFGAEDGTIADLDRSAAIYMKAGYVSEARGPETTYNGVSFYHILESCVITRDLPEWDFMIEPCMTMIEFKLYQYFHDPVNPGFFDGPGGYANRTGDSYVYDQQGHKFRDIVAADFHPTEKALVRSFRWPGGTLLKDAQELAEFIGYGLDTLTRYGLGSVSTETPANWVENHWPPNHPFGATSGWYGRITSLVNSNDPLVQTPFERSGAFNRVFGDEFWIYKSNDGNRDFGFFVEHIPSQWPYDSWAGGSLQTFWTEDTGIVILSKHDKSGDQPSRGEDTRVFSIIEDWGAHHVWGYDNEGMAFTSAAWNDVGRGVVTISTDTGAERFVEYRTGFADQRGWPEGVEDPDGSGIDTTKALLVSRFSTLQNGIKVQRTVTSDQSITITDLWDTIPVFLRDCAPPFGNEGDDGLECGLSETEISFWNGSGYTPMSTNISNTTRIRLTRDFGSGPKHVYVAFEESQRVKLSDQTWHGSYMSDNSLRNIFIDLKNGDGTVSMPATASVTYTITTTEGTPPPPGNQFPIVSISSPDNEALFAPPANISIAATATDADGEITKVEFYEGSNLIGEDTNGADGWSYEWIGVPEGDYSLTAIATDDSSAVTTSDAVLVSVGLLPPRAENQKVFTQIDTPVSVTLAASDPNGDPLSYTIMSPPTNGQLSGTAPNLTYTPNTGFEGEDNFTFVANDGAANSNVATVTIGVGVDGALLASWPFEGQGDDVVDVTGNGNDGTLIGGSRTPDGKTGNALSLNGQNECVDLGTMDISGDGLSLVLWFNAVSFQVPDARLISKATSSQPEDHWWMMSTISSEGAMRLRYRLKTDNGGTAELIANAGDLETNAWILAVVTYDGTTMKIYKDGEEVGSTEKTGGLSVDPSVRAMIGCNPGTDHVAPFDGYVDEVQVYNRALTAEEIKAIFDGGESEPTSNDDPLDSATPDAFVLHQNYPNPFQGETTITIDVPRTSAVEMSVFDVSGRKITTLMSEVMTAGTHRFNWNSEGLTSGVYLIRLQTEEGSFYQRMTLLN